MKRFSYIILGIAVNLFAQNNPDYLWPTNASEYMSSSFCEYRPGHYHSAIDIKTWNQEGYPCYAVADGKIVRIRVSPFGYGKVIYLKLDDGNYAIYAHLQKFTEAIETEIFNKQLEEERYSVSWTPKNWRVKKGEIIAYTGQTGIGVPHLHFEIRDKDERPVNPLHYYNNIKDTKYPVLKNILIVPLTKTSRVDQSIQPKSYSLTYVRDNQYIIDEPIHISGTVGLAIDGYDLADDVYNKFAFYRKELFVDGEKLFDSKYDLFDFALTRQVDIDIYYPEKATHKKTYHKLYIEPYNQLPFYDRNLGDGSIKSGSNDLPFRIEISDFWGNMSTVTGTLLVNNSIPAKMQLMKKLNDLAYLRLSLPNHIKDLHFASTGSPENWQKIDYFEILERQFNESGQTMLVKARLNEATDTLIRTTTQLNDDDRIETIAAFAPDANKSTKLQVTNTGKYLALNFYPLRDMPDLNLTLSNTQTSQTIIPEIQDDQWELVLTGDTFRDGSLAVRLGNRDETIIDTSFSFYALLPGQFGKFSFFSDSCAIEATPESVYDTLLFGVEKFSPEKYADSIPILSPFYEISSAPQVMKKGITLKIKPEPTKIDNKHFGIVKLNGDDGYSFVGGKFDSTDQIITQRIGSFGTYFIGADTVKPEVNIQFPSNGQTLAKMSQIKFRAKDALSGIGSDKNIRIAFDNRFVLPEWDPERDIISGMPHWEIEPGPHIIDIEVSDEAGNVNQQRLSIFIKAKN